MSKYEQAWKSHDCLIHANKKHKFTACMPATSKGTAQTTAIKI